MAIPALTYTITNGNTSDASQVMQNFNDLLNGVTDGTKSLTIDALTTNGSVTLGNGITKTVTINGVVSSNVLFGTTYTYSLGSSTVGLRGMYLGSADSAARTTRIQGATVASSWDLTLPTGAGTIGQFLVDSNGSGVSAWRYPEKVASKTTTYTATGDESVILCDATSAAFTVTLPAAASFTNKHYRIKKTDSSANAVTIDGNSSETIDGSTTLILHDQSDCVTIVSDGSNWQIIDYTFKRQVVVGDAETSNGSRTSSSFGDFGANTPTVTFTARRSGKFRVYCTASLSNSNNSTSLQIKIGNSAGSATVLQDQPAQLDVGTTNINYTMNTYMVVGVTAGTEYTFELQGAVGSGTITLRNGNVQGGIAVVAEELT